MFTENRFGNLNYLIHYPITYDPHKKYPVIFYFHGSGSRGFHVNALMRTDYFTLTNQLEQFEFITIAPQCHEDSWFDLWETVKGLVDTVSETDFCDPQRIYAVGASMGGYATWQIAMSMPWRFAAIIPICGGGMYWNAERLKNIPVWAFHGKNDNIVKAEESIKMAEAVNAFGGNAKLTLFDDVGHEAWRWVYTDPDVFEWLLSQHKG